MTILESLAKFFPNYTNGNVAPLMGTSEFNSGGKPCNGLASHQAQGGSRNTPSHFMLRMLNRSSATSLGSARLNLNIGQLTKNIKISEEDYTVHFLILTLRCHNTKVLVRYTVEYED